MKDRETYINEIVARSAFSKSEVLEMVQFAELNLGITVDEFYRYKLEGLSKTRQAIKTRNMRKVSERRKERRKRIRKESKMKMHEVYDDIKAINMLQIADITTVEYDKYKIWSMNENQRLQFLSRFKELKEIKSQLGALYYQIDHNNAPYSTAELLEKRAREIICEITPESQLSIIIDKIHKSSIECIESELNSLALDMEFMYVVQGFIYTEYIMFRFDKVSLPERRAFISDIERLRLLKETNDPMGLDILDDKAATYTILSKYYKRRQFQLYRGASYLKFALFVLMHRDLCVKPTYGTIGKGVCRISDLNFKSTREMYESLINSHGNCVVEEVIHASDKLRELNPDAVNSIRLVTLFDGKTTTVQDAFIKVGRKGYFVDNGGAGGIFVGIDKDTGRLCSDGVDEDGIRYERHPDTGTKFNGFQLPDWNMALSIVQEIGSQIPGAVYIGWDLAHSKNKKWVVIEGNAYTQFLGQQATVLKGKRQELYSALEELK